MKFVRALHLLDSLLKQGRKVSHSWNALADIDDTLSVLDGLLRDCIVLRQMLVACNDGTRMDPQGLIALLQGDQLHGRRQTLEHVYLHQIEHKELKSIILYLLRP